MRGQNGTSEMYQVLLLERGWYEALRGYKDLVSSPYPKFLSNKRA